MLILHLGLPVCARPFSVPSHKTGSEVGVTENSAIGSFMKIQPTWTDVPGPLVLAPSDPLPPSCGFALMGSLLKWLCLRILLPLLVRA